MADGDGVVVIVSVGGRHGRRPDAFGEGGVLAGALVGLLSWQIRRRMDDPMLEGIAMLVTPFAAFLAALPDPALADLLRSGRAVGEVAVHRQTGNRRHLYSRVHGWPDGLIAVGDALCCFDPVYGQGITVSALQALRLRAALAG